MSRMSHWLAPVVLGVAAAGASMMPATAHAQSGGDLIRILVNASDVIVRGGHAYDRHNSNYGYNDRLVVGRDRYGRPLYYRNAPRYGSSYGSSYGSGYAYGNQYQNGQQQTRCDSRGRCSTQYYDSRYSRGNGHGAYDNRYYGGRSDNHHSRRRDNRHRSGH